MATLYTINPSKRRKSRSGKKRRSAKQRAATKRMLAARFGTNPKKRRKSRKSAAPVSKKRGRRRSVKRSYRRRGSRGGRMKFNMGGAVTLLKAGAIGGLGAVATDILMGQASRVLPAALATPTDAAGNVQYGYFGTKAAVALALGVYGGKIMPPAIAEKMAEGSLTVLAYQFMRPMVPAGLALGYLNPAPTMRPGVRGAGAYVAGAGAYQALPVRSSISSGKGSRAGNVLAMARRAA